MAQTSAWRGNKSGIKEGKGTAFIISLSLN